MNTRTPEPARPPEPSRHPRGTFPYQNRPAPPPPDGGLSLSPDPGSPAAAGPRPASPPCQSSLRRRLRPPENAATLLRGARTVALALAALVLGVPETAEAQTATTFISNVGQVGSSASANPRATAFTTGGSSEGYGLTSVDVYLATNPSTVTPRVEIFRNSTSDRPGTRLATLTNPANLTGAGAKNFNDPANTMLSANTTYWLVVSNAAETDGVGFRIGIAGNAMVDDGAARGWSIGNSLFKLDISSTGWSTTGNRIIFTVKGSPVATNTPATGAPTITGTVEVGQTLTAVTTGILDANGLTSPTYTYQWIRVDSGTDSDIAGARSSTYTLAAADEGKTIKVRVTFEDDDGNTETLTSTATAVVAATTDTTPPEVKSVRVISPGTSVFILFDEALDENAANVPPVSAYAVTADGQAVTITLVLIVRDTLILFPDAAIRQGQTVVVSYTDPTAGNDTVALQDLVGNDVASFSVTVNTPATGAPTITGTAQVDQTLTAVTTGIMDADGLTSPTYTYQWIRVDSGTDSEIAGARSSTYTLAAADEGKTIKVQVTFEDDDGNTETLTSAATATVVAAAADTTPPEVKGVAVDRAGSSVSILFDEDLDEAAANVPPVSAFSVTADGQDVEITRVRISFGDIVILELPDAAISPDQTVVVSYTDPTADNDIVALQDRVGNDVASFTVTANTPATGAPTITGTVEVGQTLTAVTTGIMDANGLTGITYNHQWLRVNGTETSIERATSSTYILVAADLGKTIKVQVGFRDADGYIEQLTSAATAVVAAAADTTPPEVEGVRVDSAGSLVSIFFDEDLDEDAARAVPDSAYAVTADGQDVEITYVQISGMTVSLGFPGTPISPVQTVVVSYTDPTAGDDAVALQDVAGNDVASFSVTANAPATGAPTITGTVEVGQTLTADVVGIMDANGLTRVTYNYRWLRVNVTDAQIALATSSTYLLVAADLGKTIKVWVGFRDDAGYLDQLTSDATEVVAADTTPPMLETTNGATVSDDTLTLTYDEPLDEGSEPEPSAYTVTVGTTTTTPAVTMVSVHDSMVTLTLDPAPAAGATVTLEYEVPGTTPVQDVAGNPAPEFTYELVTRRNPPPPPPPTNTPPVVAIPPVDQEATTGDLFTYVIPADAFTDADGDPLAYTAALSDGGRLPSWLTFDPATRTFTGTPGPGDGGTVRVTVMASDGTATVSDEFVLMVTVRNTAPVVATPLADQEVMIDVPFTYVVPADAFTDADGDPLTYAAATRDGGLLPSWLTFDPATRTFTGTPASSDSGPVFVTVTASDGTATVSDEFALRVLMVAPSTLRAWTSRFGRTVATHVTDAVGERLRAPPEQDSQVTVGGYRLPLGRQAAGGGPDATEPETATDRLASLLTGLVGRALGLGPVQPQGGGTGTDLWAAPLAADPRLGPSQTLQLPAVRLRDVLLGSSFRLTLGDDAAAPGHLRLTAWGRVAGTQFDGREGDLTLDGNVLTGTVGVDSAWDRWLAGVAVSHSLGGGSFTGDGDGDLDRSTLTSIHPYLRYAVNERVDVWGVLGYGWGDMTLEPGTGGTLETDTTLLMGSFGGRGILLSVPDNAGFQLATRTDAMLTRTTSGAVAGLAETEADAHRLRLVLEGTRPVLWPEGQSVTPTVELGVRHDWGDAETGFGLELGGRVQYADPTLGLTIEAAVRGLLTHEDSDYKEWGASGTIRLAPDPNGQGLSLTLAPTWGAASSGIESLWSRQTTAGLAPQGTRPRPTTSLNAEMGYGVAAPFGTGLLTPYAGALLSDGTAHSYRLGTRWTAVSGLSLTLEGLRQESPGQQPVNQGLHLQIGWGF